MATTVVTCGAGKDFTTLPAAIAAMTGGAGDVYRIELTDAALYKGGPEGDGNNGFDHVGFAPKLEIVGTGFGRWDGQTVGQGARIGGQYERIIRISNGTYELANLSLELTRTTNSGRCIGIGNYWLATGTLDNVLLYHTGNIASNTNDLSGVGIYSEAANPSVITLNNCIFYNLRFAVLNDSAAASTGSADLRFCTATDIHGQFHGHRGGTATLTVTVRNCYVHSPAGTAWNTHANLVYAAASDYNAGSDASGAALFTNVINNVQPGICYVDAGSNYTPTLSSPLAGQGVAIPGVERDARNRTRPDPPAIGATDPGSTAVIDPTLWDDGHGWADGTIWIDDAPGVSIVSTADNMLIVTPDWSDDATIKVTQASYQTNQTPAINLQKLQPTDIWQVQSGTTGAFVLDRGSTEEFDTVVLMFTDSNAGATWQIRADDTEAGLTASPDHDSGALTFWASPNAGRFVRRHGIYRLDAPLAKRWVRIDVSGMTRAGRLYIGKAYQPTSNYQYGSSPFGYTDSSRMTNLRGGQTIPHASSVRPRKTVKMLFRDDAELLDNWDAIMRWRGKHKDLLFILDPANSTHLHSTMIYGRIVSDMQVIQPTFNIYRQDVTIEGFE